MRKKTITVLRAFTTPSDGRRANLFAWRRSDGGGKALRAFTLIEMMVAITIFAIVMMVGVGSLLSLVQANARAEAINSVMSNLNSAVESMSRNIRTGTNYYCGTSATPPSAAVLAAAPTSANDCATGNGLLFAYESATGNTADVNDQVVYRINGTQIERSTSSGVNGSWVALTAPEVTVTSLNFFLVGSPRGDGLQPRVLMRIQGTAKVPGGSTAFTVQASVVQRLLDL